MEGHEEAAGPTVTKDYKVGDFKAIESAGSYDVTVKTGSAPSVRAEGPENLLARLRIEVKGDKLQISPDKSRNFHWGHGAKIMIAITVPELRAASLAGSGSMTVDKVTGDSFEGNIAGSGELDLPAIDVKSAKFNIAGSGTARVAGKATAAEYSIAGSGDLDGAGLQSQDVKINIAGSGNIAAKATGTATGAVMGSGNVTITGGAKCDVKKMGSGSIDCS
jgi:hypothetical protein